MKPTDKMLTEALGINHCIYMYANQIDRFELTIQQAENNARDILAYSKKLHVLLGGEIPDTHGEACVMDDFPTCEPHEWDNRTQDENRQWLLEKWELN